MGLIAAMIVTKFLGIPFGWSILVAGTFEILYGFILAMRKPDPDTIHKSLDKNSTEYLSKYMPKN